MALRVIAKDGDSHSGAPAGRADRASPHRERIIDGTLTCLARQGTAKTTVDDIARQAGVSRATVYRVFPGGREEMLAAVVDTEMARLFSALGVRLGEAHDLTEALVAGIVEASTRISNHPALAYLVEHEPEMVLGHLAFDESNRLLKTASRFTAPFLARWMSPSEAERVAEWATRIVLSYAIAPSPRTDLTDPSDAEHLVTTFVIPGIDALHRAGSRGSIVITPFATEARPSPSGPAPPPLAPSSTHQPKSTVRPKSTVQPKSTEHAKGATP
jgi:AcrR family transcriptional regulator